jgi:hypothetical protein
MFGTHTPPPPHKSLGKKKSSGLVKALRKLGKLQRMATVAINVTFRTLSTDLLDAHALLPIELLLKKICLRCIVCICILPPSNPVYDQAIEYFVKPRRMHHTNIQKLTELFDIDPTVFETVPAVSRPPVF